MSEDYTPHKNEAVRVAYAAVVQKGLRDQANATCIRFGAAAGRHPWVRVPPGKASACIKALEALAGTSPGAVKAAATFEQIRKDAFRQIGSEEREAPKPAAKLDDAAIWNWWNNPPKPEAD